jgi:hypothetical protein
MVWPPKNGELLPKGREAVGIRKKLGSYSLDLSHESGGAKALGFMLILGITLEKIDYLEARIRDGILRHPIIAVRHDPTYGVACVVEFPLRGLGAHSDRVVALRTVWELPDPAYPPRLVTAFLKP